MNVVTNELRSLRENDPDLALILDTFEEIERVYQGTLEAMGSVSRNIPKVMNSAEVTVSFQPSPYSSNE